MIELSLRKYLKHRELFMNNRRYDVHYCEPDEYCKQVMDTIVRYMKEDSFYHSHPEHNISQCAFISPCRSSFVNGEPNVEDKRAIEVFQIQESGIYDYRFRILHEFGGEDLFFIPNVSLGEAMSLAAKYKQNTFIYKDERGCREICSLPFAHENGNYYEISDVVGKHIGDDLYFCSEKELARILAAKTKTCEVFGWERGNTYEPKDEFDLYLIDKPRPLHPAAPDVEPWIQKQYLLYKEIKDENR